MALPARPLLRIGVDVIVGLPLHQDKNVGHCEEYTCIDERQEASSYVTEH